MRVWASLALAAIGDDAPLEHLTEQLARYPTPDVVFAVREIGRLAHSEIRDRVLSYAQRDPREDVRRSAVEPLTLNKEDQPRLSSSLSDPSLTVRLLAAFKLLSSDRGTANAIMLIGFEQGTPAQKRMTLEAVAQQGASTDIEQKIIFSGLQSNDPSIQALAFRGSGVSGLEVLDLLARLLASPYVMVAGGAADALVKIPPTSAVGVLEKALDSHIRHVRILSAGYLIHALEVTE